MNIGEKLKKRREQQNYSQEFMANKLKITQASYSRLETGFTKVKPERLVKLAEILDVSVLYFFK